MRILPPGLVRVICVVTALASVATSCYRYETRDFDITIPEQAESSVVVARDGRHITTLVAPEIASPRHPTHCKAIRQQILQYRI